MARKAPKAIIGISARMDSKLRRVLNGTVDASKKAGKRTEDNAKRTDAQILASKKRLAKQGVTTARRAAQQVRREAAKTARAQIKQAEKAQRTVSRLADKAAKDQIKAAKKVRDNRRRLAGAVGGAVVGAAVGVAALAQRGQGAAGVQSIDQRLANAKQIRDVLIGTASEALGKEGTEEGLTKMTDELTKLVVQVSKQYQIDATQLAGALAEAQTGFAQLEDFATILPEIAALTKASVGSDPKDFVNVVGVLGDAFKLTLEEMRQLPAIIKETSAEGAISPKELASAFGPALKVLAAATGRTGLDAVREALATAQVLGTSKAKAPEVATFLEQMTRQLQRPEVREGLARVGVQVSEETDSTLARARKGRKARKGAFQGDLLPIGQIFKSLQANQEQLTKPGALTAIGIPEDVSKAFIFAMQSGDKFSEVSGAQGGQADIDRVVAKLTSGPQGELAQLRVEAQAKTIADADRIVETILPMTTALTELQTEFPLLTESMGILTGAVGGLAAVIVGQKLLGGGAAGAGGAAGKAGGLLSKGGSLLKAAGAGIAGLAGTAGAGLLSIAGGSVAGAVAVGALPGLALSGLLEATGGNDALSSFGASLGGPARASGPTSLGGKAQQVDVRHKSEMTVIVQDDRVRVTRIRPDTGVEINTGFDMRTDMGLSFTQ